MRFSWSPRDEGLGRHRSRIIIRSHGKSVGAGAHNREQVAFAHLRHLPIEREEITGFTDGSDNVDFFSMEDDLVSSFLWDRRAVPTLFRPERFRESFGTAPAESDRSFRRRRSRIFLDLIL